MSRPGAATTVIFFAFIATLSWSGFAQAPPQPEKRKLSKEQQKEAQMLIAIVDKVAQGQPGPPDVQFGWSTDFLKALEGRTYVPFTISMPPGTFNSNNVAMYLRVVSRGGAAPAPEIKDSKDSKSEKKDDRKGKDLHAFEEIYFLTVPGMKPLPAPTAGAPGTTPAAPPMAAASTVKPPDIRLSRAFAVPAGEYDLYLAFKEQGEEKKGQPPLKTAVVKHSLSVPNFWNSELSTSTVIIADKVEPMTASVSQEQQAENPYALGSTRISPAISTRFPKSAELSVIFIVYNPAVDAAKKPDISIEYSFHRKAQEGEKFFNKTAPQQFNAQTLPPQFDLASGYQLVAGQSIGLASFADGDYRLEIKITDNIAKKTLTRDVTFTVGTGPA